MHRFIECIEGLHFTS